MCLPATHSGRISLKFVRVTSARRSKGCVYFVELSPQVPTDFVHLRGADDDSHLSQECQDLVSKREYRFSRHGSSALSLLFTILFGKEEVMSRSLSFLLRRVSRCAAYAAVLYFGVVAAYTQAFAAEAERANTPGRIDFNEAKLPAATVEVDLSEGMFGDLVGLGEAAISGAAETLRQSAGLGRGSEGTRIASEQLAAAQQLVQLAHGVVHEVRVRVYQNV